MSLKIRLARAGSKKRPYYHIVVADVRSPRDGRFIEKVGSWNPLLPKDGERVKLEVARIEHWLSHGAQATDRVLRFLDQAGVVKRPVRTNPTKAEPGKKAQERVAAAKQAEQELAAKAAELAEQSAAESAADAQVEQETAAKAADAPIVEEQDGEKSSSAAPVE